MAKGKAKSDHVRRISNRRARHDYHVDETLEVGIELIGSEVKSIRDGRVSLAEGFARIEPATGELWLHDVNISPYVNSPVTSHEPTRKRRLLAHKRELKHLAGLTTAKGVTLIPLAMYFNARGIAKLQLAVARGKQRHDKRDSLAKKQADREIRRAMSRRRLG
jgi:SsrA-binding protein